MARYQDSSVPDLLSVTLTSSGLENALAQLTDRINTLEGINRAQQHRLEELAKQAPDVENDISNKHLCELKYVENLSTKSVEQQMATMAEAIMNMGQNINQFYKDVKYKEAVQKATDCAQDELMQMELDRLQRQVEIKYTRQDAIDMRKMIAAEMQAMREEMGQEFAGKLSKVYDEVLGQLSQVTDRVRVIQDSTNTMNELLKYRIEEAFTDIRSASEDTDAKIRKITEVFGLSADPDDSGAPSFPEMLKTITDLQKSASGCRDDIDVQTERTNQLSAKIQEVQESVEKQVGAMGDTFRDEFGVNMDKIGSDLEVSMRLLEQKVEGEIAGQLTDCARKLDGLAERVQEEKASTAVVESVQNTFAEQAKLQQQIFESRQEQLKKSIERDFDRKISKFGDEIDLLGGRMKEVAATAEASLDKAGAVGVTTNALLSRLEGLQRKTAAEIPALDQKIDVGAEAIQRKTEELDEKLLNLLAVVQSSRSELDSHVKASRAFVKMTADQQGRWSETSKTLTEDIDLYKAENGDRMTSLERSNISVVTSMRRLQKALDALATKEGRWDRLEVQTKRHVLVLGEHLAELEGTATVAEPFRLAPSMQKQLSAVSQMVAKIMATRADYEVTRQALNRKNPAEDTDWDNKVEALRIRYLNKFVADVVQVASRLRPLPDRTVEEVRETFAKKLELSMKLAISKYKPIQAGATILGKVHLLPACMACDRPFIDNPGPGDPRSVVQDPRGERERSSERSLERSGGSSVTGGGGRSPGRWAKGGSGGRGAEGSPVPAFTSPSAFAAEDDGGSVTSGTSLASRESQVSSSTSKYRSRSSRDRSPHKYVMRSGFKMRQSYSEGGGLVAHPRLAEGIGLPDECLLENGVGVRVVFGNANSSSANSLSTSPGGRAGLGGISEEEDGVEEGGSMGRRSGVRVGADGCPRDQINGSALELRLSTVSAQVVSRQEHGGGGGAQVTSRGRGGRRSARQGGNDHRSAGGRGGVVEDEYGFEEPPGKGDESKSLTVLLPNLQ